MELLSVTVLNTGQNRQTTREAFTEAQIDALNFLVPDGGNLPAPHEGFRLELHHGSSGILVLVHYEKTPLLKDGVLTWIDHKEAPLLVAKVAWDNGEENWKEIENIYLKTGDGLPADFASCEAPESPGNLPWLAIMRSQFGNVCPPTMLCWLEEVLLPTFAFSILANG